MITLYCGIDAGSSNCHVAMMDEGSEFVVDTEIPTAVDLETDNNNGSVIPLRSIISGSGGPDIDEAFNLYYVHCATGFDLSRRWRWFLLMAD